MDNMYKIYSKPHKKKMNSSVLEQFELDISEQYLGHKLPLKL